MQIEKKEQSIWQPLPEEGQKDQHQERQRSQHCDFEQEMKMQKNSIEVCTINFIKDKFGHLNRPNPVSDCQYLQESGKKN